MGNKMAIMAIRWVCALSALVVLVASTDAPITAAPTNSPSTGAPTPPTNAPSFAPSTGAPTPPTNAPSNAPTNVPSKSPTASPSNMPSNMPSFAPSLTPSKAPTACATCFVKGSASLEGITASDFSNAEQMAFRETVAAAAGDACGHTCTKDDVSIVSYARRAVVVSFAVQTETVEEATAGSAVLTSYLSSTAFTTALKSKGGGLAG